MVEHEAEPPDRALDAAEVAVRRYLVGLSHPERLRDEARISQLRSELERAEDPVDRLRIHAAIRRAEQVDLARLEGAFVEHARSFARSEGLEESDFAAVGVPDAVLRRAFGRGPSSSGATVAASRRPPRRTRVPMNRIREGILAIEGTFVLSDVGERVGGSPQSIRKAVEELVAQGSVVRLGPAPGHSGRGRAPIQYRRADRS